ncbi:hypothetical protein UFOVP190_2 [uncultured Caudovirales phage]|uniref:Uncharacterized protein n=1 Tax=uncultured Caudovirales phage TaxID=2100421 RepID=A0A6J7WFL7_9CAUD|nr:hypothetical protein UFOVP190_2 [uncultured Caudovirales phage]
MKSSPKRYTQSQLSKIFFELADVPVGYHHQYRMSMWVNPTDDNSLRLTLSGLQFVGSSLDLKSYKFELDEELTNQNILQLERLFQGPYYLLKRQKIIVFEESEAMMLTLHGNNLKAYLDNLESTQ